MSELTDEIKRIAAMPGCHADTQTLLAAAIKSAIPTRERPILMKGEMVRATLDDIKTNTRRVAGFFDGPDAEMAMQFEPRFEGGVWKAAHSGFECDCPYGKVGDRLWCRETFAVNSKTGIVSYRADATDADRVFKTWKPSIFMPRAASRLILEVVSIRVQRLQEISEEDSKREGVRSVWSDDQGETPGRYLYFTGASKEGHGHATAKLAFQELWDSINAKREGGKYAWAENPYVWAIEFRKS